MDHSISSASSSSRGYTTYPGLTDHHPGQRLQHNPSQYAANAAQPPLNGHAHTPPPPQPQPAFDIVEWYPAYQSCQKFFLDHAQHEYHIQVLSAFLNILLPCQWPSNPTNCFFPNKDPSPTSTPHTSTNPRAYSSSHNQHGPRSHFPGPTFATLPINPAPSSISLIPYIRRLIVTGYDAPDVMHAMFGDDWRKGIACQLEVERRNYLFMAKSVSWAQVKSHYDMGDRETVPFLRPPQNVLECEVESADAAWSDWLFVQDWQVGERGPRGDGRNGVNGLNGAGGGSG